MSPKRWSGRFSHAMAPGAIAFSASIPFDHKLAYYDIQGSLAYCRALQRAGLLSVKESRQIQKGLRDIGQAIAEGRFTFRIEAEDIHGNIEQALIRKIGALGGKLHTGRSRNDQVATDLRLYCMDHLQELMACLQYLQRVLIDKAEAWIDIPIPGYTHLQRAQPVLLSHHMLAYVEMLVRDEARFGEALERTAVMPLGSGALAGNAFPIDRKELARDLGFHDISRNSLDAVSDRDFAVEILAAGSLLMVHFSRLCEELILWSSTEFGFLKLPESYCTGSSMMPQKVNPDIPELIRGKTGRVFGDLMALLTTLKGLPLAYNKDMQEDKEPLFDLFETLLSTLAVLPAIVQGLEIERDRVAAAASDAGMLATDLADELVRQKVPFRQAHDIVARVVREATKQNVALTELPSKSLKRVSPLLTQEMCARLSPKRSVEKRKVIGGTARRNVIQEIRRHRRRLET